MSKRGKARQMRALIAKVDEVLYEEWDPIRINSNADMWDEYSSYAPGLLRYALRGDVELVADRLHHIAHETMGLPRSDRASDLRVAQRLVDLASGIAQ